MDISSHIAEPAAQALFQKFVCLNDEQAKLVERMIDQMRQPDFDLQADSFDLQADSKHFLSLANPSFAKIWNNESDAAYDNL